MKIDKIDELAGMKEILVTRDVQSLYVNRHGDRLIISYADKEGYEHELKFWLDKELND